MKQQKNKGKVDGKSSCNFFVVFGRKINNKFRESVFYKSLRDSVSSKQAMLYIVALDIIMVALIALFIRLYTISAPKFFGLEDPVLIEELSSAIFRTISAFIIELFIISAIFTFFSIESWNLVIRIIDLRQKKHNKHLLLDNTTNTINTIQKKQNYVSSFLKLFILNTLIIVSFMTIIYSIIIFFVPMIFNESFIETVAIIILLIGVMKLYIFLSVMQIFFIKSGKWNSFIQALRLMISKSYQFIPLITFTVLVLLLPFVLVYIFFFIFGDLFGLSYFSAQATSSLAYSSGFIVLLSIVLVLLLYLLWYFNRFYFIRLMQKNNE